MSATRILLVVAIMAIGGSANAVPIQDSVKVGISFIGTSTGKGVYTSEALSISVGSGAGDMIAGAWTNGNSVASAVGTDGTGLVGPADGYLDPENDYEVNICFPDEICR